MEREATLTEMPELSRPTTEEHLASGGQNGSFAHLWVLLISSRVKLNSFMDYSC